MNYVRPGYKLKWASIFKLVFIFLLLPIALCCTNGEFAIPPSKCSDILSPNINYADLKALAQEEAISLQEDLLIEGYVVSSDRAGNFFNIIHIQESITESKEGIELNLELRDSHLFYPPGMKIFIKLKGLYIYMKKGNCRIGSAMNSFGSLSISRIPTLAINEHIFISCKPEEGPTPRKIQLDSIGPSDMNTLVELSNLEFLERELGEPFAVPKEETQRTLIDCKRQSLNLINSGYSDFQSEEIPDGNGSVTGIIIRQGNDFAIKIRNTDDIVFNMDRCIDQFPLVTSKAVFITEIADPDNDTGGRFVELYNSGQEDVLLRGWELRRYTNDATEPGNSINLSGYVIKSAGTLVISSNATSFENIYGFKPDFESNLNSAADSNGDDNLELVDPFGIVIDRFGIPGEDGSSTNHEFEDGGAFRRIEVHSASPEYNFEEWLIYNDTGAEGTIKQPLNAPQDFTPGVR